MATFALAHKFKLVATNISSKYALDMFFYSCREIAILQPDDTTKQTL